MFHQYGMHGFHIFPFSIILIILLVLGFLIARSYGYFGGNTQKQAEPFDRKTHSSEALDILYRRFATGEIEEDEFQKRSQTLRQNLQ